MAMKVKKSILYHILRFVAREPEANKIAQQRFAQFAIQRCSLTVSRSKARKGQCDWYGVTSHMVFEIAPQSYNALVI